MKWASWHIHKYHFPQNISTIKYLFMKNAEKTKMTTSRRTSRGLVQLMPGPGTGPRPGGWETLVYLMNKWSWGCDLDMAYAVCFLTCRLLQLNSGFSSMCCNSLPGVHIIMLHLSILFFSKCKSLPPAIKSKILWVWLIKLCVEWKRWLMQ